MPVADAAFWRGKRVLVTGHTGFKGGWLSLWLRRLGAEVSGYALDPPTTPSLFETACVGEFVDSTRGDVRDEDGVRACVARTRPDVVFHMAAQPLVRRSYLDPVGTYATNVMGTVNLLEAVRQTGGTRVVINVTSDKCYENRETSQGYRESDPLGGKDPYSSSKACAELVSAAYRRSFFEAGPGLATARAGNVIGGGDWAEDRLIPDCIRAVSAGKPVVIRFPSAVRPWQHVMEPLSGYLMLARKVWEAPSAFCTSFNFGPAEDQARPVSWIVDALLKRWSGGTWEARPAAEMPEANTLVLDSTLARRQLGWCPRLSLDQALDLTVDWYRAWLAGDRMDRMTLAQIEWYDSQ